MNASAILGATGNEESFVENFEYKQNAMTDIVTGYKTLKHLLYKA